MNISFGRLIKRTLNRPETFAYIRQGLSNTTDPTLREIHRMDGILRKRLVIVIADVVTDSMELTINFKGNSGVAAKVALDKKLGKVTEALGDVKLDLELSKQGEGVYKIKSTTPLILARLVQNSRNW